VAVDASRTTGRCDRRCARRAVTVSKRCTDSVRIAVEFCWGKAVAFVRAMRRRDAFV